MAFIQIPQIIMQDWNLLPLPKSWWEEENDTVETKTFRLSKRSEHSGILIKLNMDEFYAEQS